MGVNIIALFLCSILTATSLMSFQANAAENEVQRKYKIDELIELALQKNPSVNSAIASIDIARGELRAAKAFPNPEAEFSLARGKSREDGTTEKEYGVTVTQPLEWPLKRHYRKKAAEQKVIVARFEKEAVEADLIYTTKQLYYSILFAEKDLEVARQNLATIKKLHSIIELRTELGETRELDFIKSRVEVLKAERELIRAEANLASVKAILNRLLGNSSGEGFEIEGELTSLPMKSSLEEIAGRVTNFNSEIKAKKAEADGAGFSLLEQKYSLIPDISLQGFYEKELDKTALGGGIGITIPFWYQRQGEIQSARAEERKVDFELAELQIEINKQLEEEYKNYKTAFEQSKIFSSELLERAKRALEITQFSYEQGEIELLGALDSLRTYRETLKEYYQVLYDFHISKITLEKIAGGSIQ